MGQLPACPVKRGTVVVVHSAFILEYCDYAFPFVSSMSAGNFYYSIRVSLMFDALV